MEFLGFSDISLFFVLFIPGFISLKVYDLLVPGQKREFSSSVLEVCAYGSINFILVAALFILSTVLDLQQRHFWTFASLLFLAVFILPILWPFLWLRTSRWAPIARRTRHPFPKAWDYAFMNRGGWVRVHLKEGLVVGGRYGENSFASSYPEEGDIYIEELWRLNDDESFDVPIPQTAGILLFQEDITAIEFLGHDS